MQKKTLFNLRVIILLYFSFTNAINSLGQIDTSKNPNLALLGNWNSAGRLSLNDFIADSDLIFLKDTLSQSGKEGLNLNFEPSGKFTDRNIQPCGNDGNIHQYLGRWRMINQDEIEIYDLVEEYNTAHSYPLFEEFDIILLKMGRFKIMNITKDSLVLKTLVNYEPLIKK